MTGRSPKSRLWLLLSTLSVLLPVLVVLSLALGAYRIPFDSLGSILLEPLVGSPDPELTQASYVVFNIRLPRLVMALLVGSALALSGATLQSLFRNPLAESGLVGISSGATLGAVIFIVFVANVFLPDAPVWELYALPVMAFSTGLIFTYLVFRLASSKGHTPVSQLLLSGVAINALVSAAVGFILHLSTDNQIRNITFWSLGSLSRASWSAVLAVAPFILSALVFLPLKAKSLNVLLLGEAEAAHLGVRVTRLKRWVVLFVALAVGASVAFTGIIGFVGLVVPHIVRMVVGPDHRRLLPLSAIGGGILVLGADLLARTVTTAELPIGVITSALGAPFFMYLLRRRPDQL